MIKIEYKDKSCMMNEYLVKRLNNIKKILRKKWDAVILIDGMERSGKSTLGMTCGWFISEGNMTLNNVASDSDDAIKKCETLPDHSVLLLDEGSLIFSSKDALNSEQKKLVKILNVIGQKNMVFIIVLPSFFDLNKFIAVSRSRFLLHVYPSKTMARGRFVYFSEKKKRKLYDYGKKHFNSYKYPKATFIGRFTDFFPFDNKEEYFKIKKQSLFDSFHHDKKEAVDKIKEEHEKILRIIQRVKVFCENRGVKVTQRDLAELNELSLGSINNALRGVGSFVHVQTANNINNLKDDEGLIKQDGKQENN